MRRWLFQENAENRRGYRWAEPEIVVHYWDGAAPDGREIRDISDHGAYIITAEKWYPGTIIRIILQRRPSPRQCDVPAAEAPASPSTSICVPARVIRNGAEGVAVEFAFRNKQEEKDFRDFLAAISPQTATGDPAPARKGQALIEFALIIPLVLLLAVNALNFGGFIFAWITVAGAARSGAEYMIMSSASPGGMTPATPAQVAALVTNDVTSLLNRSSVVVATCTNSTVSANGCTTFSDPEAPSYTLATVDVTYTYRPFIPLFSFPGMGIAATLPSTTIHRKAVMRMLQ
jgi:Flp pilus assembly protein TadG